MGVKCEIIIQKAKSGVFRPGQHVVGTVKYIIDKPTKLKTIDISFLGKGTCEWSVPAPDNTSVEYSNKEEYVNDIRNLFDAKNNQKVLLSGTFEYPFDFLLPDDIPSSIQNNTGGKIEYKVIVRFVKASSFKIDQEYSRVIRVYGYVSPCSPEPLTFSLQKSLFALTSNNTIDIKGEIDKTFLTPGDNIKLNLSIHNETDVQFTIKIELIEYYTSIASNKKTRVTSWPLKTSKFSTNIVEKSLSIITHIVPTLPGLYSIQNSKILTGEYRVRVTAKLPFPYNNADVEVPVVIGEKRDHVEATAMGTDYDEEGHPSTKITTEDEINIDGEVKEAMK